MPSKAGSSAEAPILILPDLSFDDEGLYECEAYNSEGSDTHQGRINVQGTQHLEGDRTQRDKSVTKCPLLICANYPDDGMNVKLVWMKNTTHTPAMSRVCGCNASHRTFPLPPYSEPPAQPEWLQVMSDSEVEISSELLWSCIAAGKPRPSVRWLRNGQPLSTQVTRAVLTHRIVHLHTQHVEHRKRKPIGSKFTFRSSSVGNSD